jgi:hypothetical protein
LRPTKQQAVPLQCCSLETTGRLFEKTGRFLGPRAFPSLRHSVTVHPQPADGGKLPYWTGELFLWVFAAQDRLAVTGPNTLTNTPLRRPAQPATTRFPYKHRSKRLDTMAGTPLCLPIYLGGGVHASMQFDSRCSLVTPHLA